MIEVNGIGQACPIPVVLTKKALKNNAAQENIVVYVDNKTATENLGKMAAQMGIPIEIKKLSEKEYHVFFMLDTERDTTAACPVIDNPMAAAFEEYAVALSAKVMGAGDAVLGEKLLEGFVYALTEQDVLPSIIVCYNAGVSLTTENEKTIEDLKQLESRGCEVLSCGLCLDFYGLTEKVAVGSITNMYRIAEILRSYRIVRP